MEGSDSPITGSRRGGLPGDHVLLGALCCITSACAYSVTQALLRFLSVQSEEPLYFILTLFVKETVTVILVGPWVAWAVLRNWSLFPRGKTFWILVGVSLAVQWIANLVMLWALGVIGLAVTVPIMLGSNLTFSALFGWLFLKEPVTKYTSCIILLIIFAITLLSFGGGQVGKDLSRFDLTGTGFARVAFAVLGTCLAGLIFGLFAVTIRLTVRETVPPFILVFFVTGVGTVTFGPVCFLCLGVDAMSAVPTTDYGMMLLAGVANFVGFVMITKGLQMTPVVRANVINASQTAFAAILGFLVFHEPPTVPVVCGVLLTAVGMVLISRPVKKEEVIGEI
jgi:drug/metabolite transporter (DMT)-like permease